jgi:hypothetical protein
MSKPIAVKDARIFFRKSLVSAQIPTELIQAGSETLTYEIDKLSNYIFNKEQLADQWKDSYYCANLQKKKKKKDNKTD